MIFDLTPLTVGHLLLFGASFVVLHLLLSWLLQWPATLRQHPQYPQVYYAGALLIGVVSVLSFFVLDNIGLKIGLLCSAVLTLLIGIVDEQLRLTPLQQLLWQGIIAVVAAGWGWTIHYVSHPLQTGIIDLDWFALGSFLFPGSILTVLWLVFLMNAVNWLDGVDGLASGVGVVALLTLSLVSLLPSTQDARTLQLGFIGAGAVLGVLLWNFPPARVYLGTSGSWFLGLYIGLVAIVGGGKVVTTLLVLALPVLDFLAVSLQRLAGGQAPWQGDAMRHLHHRLQHAGWSARTITLVGIMLSMGLGAAAIMLQTKHKLYALAATAAMLALVIAWLLVRELTAPANEPTPIETPH